MTKELTPAELDRWAAEKLMGWTKTFLPFDPNNWWWEKNGEVKAWFGEWSPTSNQSPAWQILACIDAMRKLGFDYSIMSDYTVADPPHGAVFFPFPHDGKGRKIIRGSTMLIAFLRAAYAAVEG